MTGQVRQSCVLSLSTQTNYLQMLPSVKILLLNSMSNQVYFIIPERQNEINLLVHVLYPFQTEVCGKPNRLGATLGQPK